MPSVLESTAIEPLVVILLATFLAMAKSPLPRHGWEYD